MKPRLLIVDDHGEIRRLLRLSLDDGRYEIHEAADGEQALLAAHRLQPRAVLLDVMMPGHHDGLSVCRQLKAEPALAGIRILLLSARGQRADIKAGQAAGADGYFLKPFSPAALADRVEALLAEIR